MLGRAWSGQFSLSLGETRCGVGQASQGCRGGGDRILGRKGEEGRCSDLHPQSPPLIPTIQAIPLIGAPFSSLTSNL